MKPFVPRWVFFLFFGAALCPPPFAWAQGAEPEGRPPRPEDGGGPPQRPGPGQRPQRPGQGGPGSGGKGPGGGGGKGRTGGVVVSNRPLQDLWIPPLVEGKTFNLELTQSTRKFLAGTTTTMGFNGASFWGPTLVFNQGETVQVNFKNNLEEVTTVHWHGFHLPATMDGGPHQTIAAGGTWSPSWKVANNAGTYWYHPHPHELTQKQIAMGAGGLIIVRDPEEAKLGLPRTYGVDDLPVVLTSRRFTSSNQFSYDGDNDKYGDYLLTNGVMDAQTKLPAQWVRLRILNAEIERGYILGFADNREFYQIATDGGLVDKPIPMKRVTLVVGERTEILVNLGGDKVGGSLDLMAYNSNQPFGFPGGEPDSGGANGSLLNNGDFRVLKINIGPANAQKLAKIPEVLTKNHFPADAEVSVRRKLAVAGGRPTFSFDGLSFAMTKVNQVVKLGDTETWTVTNNNIFGHAFHIHDVQFKIVSRSDRAVGDYEQGWKDTVYLPRGASVTFIAKFDDFASDTDAFMYHCHMANHEDGGMMGQFLVSQNPSALKKDASGAIVFRPKMDHPLTAQLVATAAKQTGTSAPNFTWTDAAGKPTSLTANAAGRPTLLYFIEKECPCSRDAAAFINQLQSAYGSHLRVVGIINADSTVAEKWSAAAQAQFTVVADPKFEVINAYKAERSASTILVSSAGAVVKSNPGYSATVLEELTRLISRQGRTPPAEVNFKSAPDKLTSGCPLQ
jgi:bilirubin oxidase